MLALPSLHGAARREGIPQYGECRNVEKVLHGWCNKKYYTTVYNSQQELRCAIESRACVAGNPDQT
jgi:hypothetical protein